MKEEITKILACVVVGALIFGITGAVLFSFLVPMEYIGRIATVFAATGGLIGFALGIND